MRLADTNLAALLPPTVLAGGPEAFRPKLSDPSFREELKRTMRQGPRGLERWGGENLLLVNAPALSRVHRKVLSRDWPSCK